MRPHVLEMKFESPQKCICTDTGRVFGAKACYCFCFHTDGQGAHWFPAVGVAPFITTHLPLGGSRELRLTVVSVPHGAQSCDIGCAAHSVTTDHAIVPRRPAVGSTDPVQCPVKGVRHVASLDYCCALGELLCCGMRVRAL